MDAPPIGAAALVSIGLLFGQPNNGALPDVGDILYAAGMHGSKCHDGAIPDRYDSHFRAAANTYWTSGRGVFWCALKAQALQESSLNPRAVSHAGAKGLFQHLDSTWAEYERKNNLAASPFDAVVSIHFGAQHMEYLFGFWSSPRPLWPDHFYFAWTSYFAGQYRVLGWQRECDMGVLWEDVLPCIDGPEARLYAAKVHRWMSRLQGRS